MSVKWILSEIESQIKRIENGVLTVSALGVLKDLQKLAAEEYENKEKYNGWTNYETWNVKLWIDNDQGSYNHWRENAKECLDNAQASEHFTKEEQAVLDLMDILKDQYEEMNPLADNADTYTDLLNAALSEVNWHEIAKSIIEEIQE